MLGKSNRIQVDLDLLEAESLKKLEQFGQDFNNSIDRLAGLISGGQGGGQRAGNTVVGALSPNASTPGQTYIPAWADARGTMLNTDSGSYPPNDITGRGGAGVLEEGMTQFQKRVGEGIPTSLRQFLGYYGDDQLQVMNPFAPLGRGYDPNGPIATQGWSLGGLRDAGYRQDLARRANSVIFNMQATKALAMKAMGSYSSFTGGAAAIANAGWSTNALDGSSRAGWLGPLFSGSFFHGLNENLWTPLRQSDFGFGSLFGYGYGQAASDNALVNSYGWSQGNFGQMLDQTLKENNIKYGVDSKTQMALLDPMVRWGASSFTQLNNVLASIPAAATAAGYNLQQFAQELVATSQQVAQATGMSMTQTAAGISAISATTGLPPQQAGQLMSWKNSLLASAYTGKKPWDIMYGTDQQAFLAPALTRLQSMMGMSAKQWSQWFHHGNHAQVEAARKAKWMIQGVITSNPDIFGGMSFDQMIHMLTQGGIGEKGLLRQTHVIDALSAVTSKNYAGSNHQIEALIRQYYHGNSSATKEALDKYTNYLANNHNARVQDRVLQARDILLKDTPLKRRDTSNQMIGLTPEAKKLVQLMGNDPAHQNSGGSFGRWASTGMSWGEKTGIPFAGIAGGLVGGIAGGIDSLF